VSWMPWPRTAWSPQAFVVPGRPVQWSRAVPRKQGVGYATDRRTIAHQRAIRLAAAAANVRPFEGPVILECLFVFATLSTERRVRAPAPARHRVAKPDLSNLLKCVEDALQERRARRGRGWPALGFHDDEQVVGYGRSTKVHAAQDDPQGARTIVTISPAGEELLPLLSP